MNSNDDPCGPPMPAKGSIQSPGTPSRWPSGMRFIKWTLFVVCQFAAGELYAEASDTDAEEKFVSGRLGVGAIVSPRYSGGARNGAFPVPLASLRFGDYAYIDYWQAGLYVLGNQEKTIGLAVVVTPRLGFNARDGERLSGMMTRKSSIETGLSFDYGSDSSDFNLGYLHDVTGASDGSVVRLPGFRRIDISNRFGVETFVRIERLNSATANYYYGVADHEATAARPFYRPDNVTDPLALQLRFRPEKQPFVWLRGHPAWQFGRKQPDSGTAVGQTFLFRVRLVPVALGFTRNSV